MDWFVYDRDLCHERVEKNPHQYYLRLRSTHEHIYKRGVYAIKTYT